MKHYRITTDGNLYRVEVAPDRFWSLKLKWQPAIQGVFGDDKTFSSYESALIALDCLIRQKNQSWRLPETKAPKPPAVPNPGCVDGCVRHEN